MCSLIEFVTVAAGTKARETGHTRLTCKCTRAFTRKLANTTTEEKMPGSQCCRAP